MAAVVAEPAAGLDEGVQPVPAAERGALVVSERAVEKIATLAAGEVTGVVSSGSGLDHLLGQRLPKVDATVAGGRARVQVKIAVTWPQPLARVCGQVRDTVTERLQALAGLEVDAVDVLAAKVVADVPTPRRRVQ